MSISVTFVTVSVGSREEGPVLAVLVDEHAVVVVVVAVVGVGRGPGAGGEQSEQEQGEGLHGVGLDERVDLR